MNTFSFFKDHSCCSLGTRFEGASETTDETTAVIRWGGENVLGENSCTGIERSRLLLEFIQKKESAGLDSLNKRNEGKKEWVGLTSDLESLWMVLALTDTETTERGAEMCL